MSSLSFLSAASLILLLTAVCRADYEVFTMSPDYDYDDDNSTLKYNLYSNASNEELDKLTEMYDKDDTGGKQEDVDVTVTVATTSRTTERGRIDVRNAASLPVSLEIWTLFCPLLILTSLNTPHLQQTL